MPMTDFTRTLVVGDGDLASILGCAAASDAALLAQPDPAKRREIRPILWAPPFEGPTAPARQWATRRQAELFEMELVESPPTGRPSESRAQAASIAAHLGAQIADLPSEAVASEWPSHSRDLLHASMTAIARRCSTVLWPIHSTRSEGPDIDQVARAIDRAMLISRLIALDADLHGNPAFRIDAPYIDFSDRQLADLVIDMDLPVRLCWWWHAEMARGSSTEFRAQHDRWTPVLREVGWRIDSQASRERAASAPDA